MDEPAYRGAVCHSVLAAIEAEPRVAPRVLASVDASNLELIRRATKLSWVPLDALDQVNSAYLREVGREAYLDFWRRYALGAVDSSLFSALFSGALRIFGNKPDGLLRWVGRAWDISTRNLGHAVITKTDDLTRVAVVDIPPSGRRVTLALSTQASVMAVIELTQHVSEVECDVRRLESEGRYEILARWFPAVAASSG